MNNIRKEIGDYLLISIGTALIAMAVALYLIPCHIVTGSVSGLSLILSEIFNISDSLLVLFLNIVCMAMGIRYLGKKFGVRCLYVSVLLPLLIEIISPLNESMTLQSGHQLINVAMFLILLTSGQCLLLINETDSGGLDTIAEVVAKKTNSSFGLMVAVSGVIVALLTIGVYGFFTALAGALVTLVNGMLIEVVMKSYRHRNELIKVLRMIKI